MKRLRWYSMRALETLGWAGVAAVLLFVAAGALHGYGVWRAEQPGSDSVSSGGAGRTVTASPAVADAQLELQELEKTLKSASLEDNLQALHDAGRATSVELKRLEYRIADNKRWRLKQYQIVAPVTSTYPRIRDFIGLALAKVPSLALDHVSFQKRKVGDTTVDAELRFTLFISDAP
jgi:hypothetical protein